jgi:hypothetical protein
MRPDPRPAARTRAVVFDAGSTPFLEVSAVKMLSDLAHKLSASGVRLLIAHARRRPGACRRRRGSLTRSHVLTEGRLRS